MGAILKKELKYWFLSPSFYVLLFAMHITTLYYTSVMQIFSECRIVVGLVTIGIGSSVISREFKMKTYKLLFSSPISISSIVLAKFLVVFCQVFSVYFVSAIIKMIVFAIFGYSSFVMSEIVLGFIAMAFLIAFFSAVVIFMSCWGEKTGVIIIFTYSGFLVLETVYSVLFRDGTGGNIILKIYELFFFYQRPFFQLVLGVFSLQSVGYFVVMTCSLLFLSKKFLESKRYL